VNSIRALAEIGSARPHLAPKLVEEIVPFLEDKRILVSERTPPALVLLGHPGALPALHRRGETAALAGDRESSLKAAEELSAKLKKGEEVDRLRGEAEKLREEVRELRSSVEAMKARVMPEGTGRPAPKGRAGARAKQAARSRKVAAKEAVRTGARAAARPAPRKVAAKSPASRRKGTSGARKKPAKGRRK
jgi:hypothetical protein